MKQRTKLVLAAGIAVAAVAWYFFRPDRAFIDARVSEAAPNVQSTVLLAGEFRPRTHDGRGLAQVLELPDGQRVLRFSSFETLNGPDLQVYLLAAPDVRDRAGLETAGFVTLGALKGNVGDQNYVIPPGTDLSRYRAVSVWCRRFGVNFTTAELARGGQKSS
ncbi:MAG TPA: DM13 domain-containing protein [Gemmatimonadaceae bacterium]|jgi:hypothetical protein|nr:DM13 domain-containing protein [Gemmatimonadaceae bacterium]